MKGFLIAPEGSKYEGKLVEYNAAGGQVRPWDISITKVTFALLFNSVLLLHHGLEPVALVQKTAAGSEAPGGFIGLMEMFIMMVNDDIIKSCVGPNYRKFAPYLLTAFFFIFINNHDGADSVLPRWSERNGKYRYNYGACSLHVPGSAISSVLNITGKISSGPDVPWWLKVPMPMMPFIELFGIFTKPFALMIRLFANMLAGHMAMLVLTCLNLYFGKHGACTERHADGGFCIFNIFMNALELLVAFIQAYVFTMFRQCLSVWRRKVQSEKAEEN